MASPKLFAVFLLFSLCSLSVSSASLFSFYNWNRSAATIEMPAHLSFNTAASAADTDCHGRLDDDDAAAPPLKLHLRHRSARDPAAAERSKKDSVLESANRDLLRIHTLHRRITERKNQDAASRLSRPATATATATATVTAGAEEEKAPELAGRLVATLESGVALGSGEYLMDAFVGTPPRHYSLILDTGSDLNWVQCAPCHDCFAQHGPHYDPAASSSYRAVGCGDPRCALVAAPDPPQPCRSPDDPCPYFYWYGDRSNTTGDLALETFTVNLTAAGDGAALSRRVEGVVFGCGHWNRGLFHGAAGLLGLGRGPLSFSSQLRSLYGHTFSYCLVDRDSDLSVSSKLIFGEDRALLRHPDLNFTSFVAGKDNPADTFYYVQVKGVMVGGELLDVPAAAWDISPDGAGGTIVDSGTTLSYFPEPAYRAIRDAFAKRVTNYPPVEGLPPLDPCYNVSGAAAGTVRMPEFAIVFTDGAVWNFPMENYFIQLEPEGIMCLAVLGMPPHSSQLSIIGNYQQQNFHILYDTKHSRLGFAPMKCAQV